MGFFSWKTSDTDQTVMNRHTGKATPCKMIDNQGNEYIELNYNGYGDFGGMDYYVLVDLMNGGTGDGCRDRGINLAFNGSDEQLPKIVSIDCTLSYAELKDSDSAPGQGYWSD